MQCLLVKNNNLALIVFQIVCVMNHFVSFVQVRGSVPVFWSQPGYKYRPPPRLDKGTRFSFFCIVHFVLHISFIFLPMGLISSFRLFK